MYDPVLAEKDTFWQNVFRRDSRLTEEQGATMKDD